MPTLRHRFRRQLDAGVLTPLLICAMGVVLWFVSHHWHERTFTMVGMGCLAALSLADLRRRRRHAANERTLQSILDAVPDILFFKDTTLRYRRVNRAFASTFRLDVDAVAGHDDKALFGKRLHDRFVAQDRQLLAGGEARTFDERMRIDGQLRDVRARKQPVFDARGRAIGIVGIAIDLTEERRVQQQLAQALQDAQDADAAKTRFLAMMSHEIRTPMNGVLGMIDLLGDTPLRTEQRRLLDCCRASSVALLTILNDILDFSKIEAGKLALEHVPVALRPLIDEVCASLATQAGARNVRVGVSVAREVPDAVVGDAVRLRQILLNLVGNAVKFTADGRVDVEVHVDSSALQLRVRDTGPGMTAEAVARLFQPFEQADAATTRQFGGTGLGLSIVKRLAELMGGGVRCESTFGVGSVFTVTLPLVAAAMPERDMPQPASALPPRGLRALLAEDHPVNREVIAGQLEKLGWTCDMAEDGEAAWTVLSEGDGAARYAALITDCHMPRLDGYGLVARVRAHEAAGRRVRLPILALTANAMQGERERCLAAGMDAYLAKPFQVDQLAEALAVLTNPA
ncbi:Multi-sensor hybrid histidine kinase [Lysobacter dokdonensis DS-58]|uniref:histidine kinase n=1 Tax=Lysobacter dokdonensis DS-58 TaxID=1300345 RepID=A0A0A2WJJ9_9GAMM|nr:PAS domain-containing sensor histidine kinase [Lysobacter dokdonensis]KGQ18897.1 Multi-sensor hybrid histidine kinase [Lysobacter dokdonensis DS-58]